MSFKEIDTVRIKSTPKEHFSMGPSVGMCGYIEELSADGTIAYFHELGKDKEYGAAGSIHVDHLEHCSLQWLIASRDSHLKKKAKRLKEAEERMVSYNVARLKIALKHGISLDKLKAIHKDLQEIDSPYWQG